MSPGMVRLFCLTLLALATVASGANDDEEDFVPKFFGGRRTDGDHAGIVPPKPQPKTRGGLVRQKMLSFTQKLNHFNSSCRRCWTQRYLMDDQHFKANRSRPIVFIRIGGESTVRQSDLSSGAMVTLAKKHGALLLALEHRFYGESRPTVDTKPSNLRLLTSNQALVDLTTFIRHIRKQYFSARQTKLRIVIYGCSYAGALAARHRTFYPNSTLGAVAQCAPMFPRADLEGYFTWALKATGLYDQECRAQILNTFGSLHYLVNNQKDKSLDLIFDLCEPKKLDADNIHAIDSLYYDLVSELMVAVQYNKMSDGRSSSVGRLCDTIKTTLKGGKTAIYGYAEWLKQRDCKCLVHDGKTIVTRNASWGSTYVDSGTRQWLYQMCNEFGYFTTIALNITSESKNSSAITQYADMSFFEKICTASFHIADMQTRVNKSYNASSKIIYKLSNVIFLNGDADPWRSAGIKRNYTTASVETVDVPGMSHCEEPNGTDDSNSALSNAWNEIYTIVNTWLAKA